MPSCPRCKSIAVTLVGTYSMPPTGQTAETFCRCDSCQHRWSFTTKNGSRGGDGHGG